MSVVLQLHLRLTFQQESSFLASSRNFVSADPSSNSNSSRSWATLSGRKRSRTRQREQGIPPRAHSGSCVNINHNGNSQRRCALITTTPRVVHWQPAAALPTSTHSFDGWMVQFASRTKL